MTRNGTGFTVPCFSSAKSQNGSAPDILETNANNRKMSDGNNNDSAVYIFQGKKGEKVPENVEKLIIDQGVRVLPGNLCYGRQRLREVTLSYGLIRIEFSSFAHCENLMEIKISSTVQHIGENAFRGCMRLTKVEFGEISTTASAHHQLQTIENGAFGHCRSLPRIKLPSSVTSVGEMAFSGCTALTEANLSTTEVTEIAFLTFAYCKSLQTIILPSTLNQIGGSAFEDCSELVTVVVPLDTKSITIGFRSFERCKQLVNLLLPNDSTAKENSFGHCAQLQARFERDIVAGLTNRFDDLHAVHRMCYDHSRIIAQQLRQCIEEHEEVEDDSFVDEFGMTPFHILFSTSEPNIELLQVLLEQYPSYQLLHRKNDNDKRPVDYLISNWTETTISLLQRSLQKWMIDPLARWGAMLQVEEMKTKVRAVLSEDDKERRVTLFNEACSAFGRYEKIECTSILELALWKRKLKSGRSHDGSKRQALDRGECRCVCGADVVIPNVTPFLLAY